MEFSNSQYKGFKWKINGITWSHERSLLRYSLNYRNKKEKKDMLKDLKKNNRQRIINCFLMNNLVMGNTVYEHKDIPKHTREMSSRNKKNIVKLIGFSVEHD